MNFNFRKIFILVFCLTIFQSALTAQSEVIKFGFSLNKNSYDRFNYELNDSIGTTGIGFSIGIAYEIPVFNHTSLSFGFSFSQRNYEVKYFDWPNSDRTNWATFPFQINYYLIKNLAFNAGCQIEHLIFKQKFVYYSDSLQQKSGYTKYDVGLIGGLQFRFRRIELNGSFIYGLRKISDTYFFDPLKGIGINSSAKSYSIKIGLYYLFY